MLKIIKYDLKSTGIIMAVIGIVAIVTDAVFFIAASNSLVEDVASKLIDGTMFNVGIYIIAAIAIIGNLWRKVNSDTELYEMAGVSPLKVAAARMLLVFAAISIIAVLLTILDTILYGIYLEKINEYSGIMQLFGRSRINETMFAINGMRWTNIFTPLFAGLYASILFTTSMLFATINRRLNSRFASTLLFAAIVTLVLLLNFGVMNKINLYLPELNLNKLGTGLIIERFGCEFANKIYGNICYILNPNLLNLGLLIFQGLYVALMFSIYSIRRKAI